MKLPTTKKTPEERLLSLLAIAIRKSSAVGESLSDTEGAARFVAATFYYRDFPAVEEILRRETDPGVIAVVDEAMRRAGLRGDAVER